MDLGWDGEKTGSVELYSLKMEPMGHRHYMPGEKAVPAWGPHLRAHCKPRDTWLLGPTQ